MQKTDRQVEELVSFAKSNRLNFDESTDIYKDIISGFKDGEDRPNFSILMAKLEMGEYTQVLFNEYSARQKEATENYTTVLKRAIRYARDEDEADALVAEAKEDYDRVSEECAKSLERIKAELDGLKHLKTISTNMSLTLFYTNPMNLGCS